MSKLTKNQKSVAEKVEAGKTYTLKEAAALVKEITTTKFDASLDIDVRLGVDPRKANQMVRGVVSLPNGTGKVMRVLCLCTPDQEAAAKEAGADYVGLDEYIEKIKGGWTDIDVIITTGGTGIAQRDVTIEAVKPLLTKEIEGFGELFRYLSYVEDVGTRALLSRAVAGTVNNKLIFSIPGSTGAVKLALEKLIKPELNHLIHELTK